MLYLSEQQVGESLGIDRAIEVVENAYRELGEGLLQSLPRTGDVLSGDGDSYLMVSALSKKAKYFGFKYAGSFPTNTAKGLPTVNSSIMLCSAETGETVAIIESNTLTALKTAASSAVATKFLAKPEAKRVTIIGAGLQSFYQLTGALAVRDVEEIRIFDLSLENANRLAGKLDDYKNIHSMEFDVTICKDTEEALKNADILITITTSKRPVVFWNQIPKGLHINAMGSFTPEMQELDSDIVMNADRIVVDTIRDAWDNAGDLIAPLNLSKITKDALQSEMHEIICESKPGRITEQEVTLFESVGFGALDVAVAIEAYRLNAGK